jgi:hypothetical protein
MQTLRYLLVGGVLMLGAAIAKDAPKPATPAAHASQTNAKKQHKKAWRMPLHKKAAKTTATPPAKAAPVTVAHKK